jgi:hypothetical protein
LRKHGALLTPALLGLTALAVIVGIISSGLFSSEASEPHGVLSLDAINTGNTASAVGTIEDSNTITDTCGTAGGILVQLVLGNANSSDGTGASAGIPSNRDVGGWSAEINFDPTQLTFTGHTFNTAAAGAGFFMEKASDRDDDIGQNDHIAVSAKPASGVVLVGSTVLGRLRAPRVWAGSTSSSSTA